VEKLQLYFSSPQLFYQLRRSVKKGAAAAAKNVDDTNIVAYTTLSNVLCVVSK